jgi:hypothetical protein
MTERSNFGARLWRLLARMPATHPGFTVFLNPPGGGRRGAPLGARRDRAIVHIGRAAGAGGSACTPPTVRRRRASPATRPGTGTHDGVLGRRRSSCSAARMTAHQRSRLDEVIRPLPVRPPAAPGPAAGQFEWRGASRLWIAAALRRTTVRDEWFEPLIRPAVHDPNPTFNRQSISPAMALFGRETVRRKLLGLLTAGSSAEMGGRRPGLALGPGRTGPAPGSRGPAPRSAEEHRAWAELRHPCARSRGPAPRSAKSTEREPSCVTPTPDRADQRHEARRAPSVSRAASPLRPIARTGATKCEEHRAWAELRHPCARSRGPAPRSAKSTERGPSCVVNGATRCFCPLRT